MEVKDGARDTSPAVEVGSLVKRYGELVDYEIGRASCRERV